MIRARLRYQLRNQGFSLLELLIGTALGAVVLLGMMQLLAGSRAAQRQQYASHHLQQDMQAALNFIAAELRQAGSDPQPWKRLQPLVSFQNSVEGGHSSDTIEFQYYSEYNCFGNANPVTTESGQPLLYRRVVRFFHRTPQRQLAWRCRYGSPTGSLTTQVNNQTLIESIDQLQFLYGEDLDGNGGPDLWVRAGGWQDPARITGVRLGLLLRADIRSKASTSHYQVLDTAAGPFDDKLLRRVAETTLALRNRL